ncbi:MAG: Mur ligase family protein, partial [Chlorobi bacterium]|nr:Mur ligase family protein [Chlorobiota bacterium]
MQHILEKLYSLHQRGIKPGLERVEALLAAVGNPHRDLRAIHIAGTNGKGTVSSIIASVLAESGEKVGLYTSPHLRSFNERIRINGQPISNTEVIELYNALETTADQIEATFFEITTVMAFLKFKKSSSLQVIECGLGGRLDS